MLKKGLKAFLVAKKLRKSEKHLLHLDKYLPVKSAVLLVDENNIFALEDLKLIRQDLQLKAVDFHVLIAANKKLNETEAGEKTITWKDVSLTGEVKNVYFDGISSKGADLLITFAEGNSLLLSLLTSRIKAGIKAGNRDNKFLNLVIASEKPEQFRRELITYLKQLKINDG